VPVRSLSLTELNAERRLLHATLKQYERAFQAQHGRQVTRQEDIAPVANEYRRYKDVKALLAAMDTGTDTVGAEGTAAGK
jgi:hypothetical protein